MRYLVTKIFADRLGIDDGVFNDVVQQTGRNRHRIEPHVGENVCDLERMDQIGFARRALLAFMLARGKKISAPQQI